MAMSSETVIECRDVHLWYGEYEALRGVNLGGETRRGHRHLRTVWFR